MWKSIVLVQISLSCLGLLLLLLSYKYFFPDLSILWPLSFFALIVAGFMVFDLIAWTFTRR